MFTAELSKTIEKTVGKINNDISSLAQRRVKAVNIFEETRTELSAVNDEISQKIATISDLASQLTGMRTSLEVEAIKNTKTIDQLTSLLEG